MHRIGEPVQGRTHTVFVDEPAQLRAFDPAAHFDTEPEHLQRAFNRPRRNAEGQPATPLAEEVLPSLQQCVVCVGECVGGVGGVRMKIHMSALPNPTHRKRASLYKELQQRVERHSKLQKIAQDMHMEKAIMVRDGCVV